MNTHRLWYTKPADELPPVDLSELTCSELAYDEPLSAWETYALPVGNAYMGAMVYGSMPHERIQFNEKTLWTGGPGSKEGYRFGHVPGGAAHLDAIRALLLDGKKDAAMDLAGRHLVGEQNGFGSYQNFGEIFIRHKGMGTYTAYERGLDLDGAVESVAYEAGGARFRREVFCSYPDHVLAIRLTADAPGALDVEIGLVGAQDGAETVAADGGLVLSGAVPDNGLAYEARLAVAAHNGMLAWGKDTAVIHGASELVLLMSCGTDYRNAYPHYRGEHPRGDIAARLHDAGQMGWDTLLRRHQEDHRALYRECALSLREAEKAADMPTDALLRAYRSEPSAGLESLMFHYGRYLLIASSRPGTLPANLQGVWNASNTPAWCGDYHFDINLQMNYWPADITGLAECSEPLVDYIESLMEPGGGTARLYFGSERGWVVNTMNNPFGFTAPGWRFTWGWAPNSNAFIAMNLWEKYLFSRKEEDLRRLYPMLRGTALFWLDFLTVDTDGTLVSSPSFSPEHGLCEKGCAMDQQLAWFALTATHEAAATLRVDEALQAEIASAVERLSPPLRIGRWGQLQEWKDDLDDPEDTHRHISQVAALYPGCQINRTTRAFMDAARVSLLGRGDASTGWSRAWKTCLWARLLDGGHAYRLLRGQLQTCTYPNLFDTHPPFQIDGNFGYVAGVCEMLVHSHMGMIELLPALPSAWPDGHLRGVRARGGFRLDIRWARGVLAEAAIYSSGGHDCVVRTDVPESQCLDIRDGQGRSVPVALMADGGHSFATEKGETYRVSLR